MDAAADTGVDLDRFLANAQAALLAELGDRDHWRGELSASALSTATAIVALRCGAAVRGGVGENAIPAGVPACAPSAAADGGATPRRAGGQPPDDAALIAAGVRWLVAHQNADGGWGDTVKSFSNISTTTLCWAALRFCGDESASPATQRASAWLAAEIDHAGAGRRAGPSPARSGDAALAVPAAAPDAPLPIPALVAAIESRYGTDRTFAVPILTLCAIAGVLGDDPWRWVRPLPFELAALPRWCFRLVNMQVVSYALPALVAVGQARHRQRPSGNPFARGARALTRRRTLRLLDRMQPSSGGFLEAIPLTSFVAMSLCAAGERDHAVTARCLAFLRRSARADGSWAIDSDLATWCTTLAVNALAAGSDLDATLGRERRRRIADWLLAQQHRTVHPFTGAAPGGWAWTDLPGGVPDADDTSGALIALKHLAPDDPRVQEAARLGLRWLAGLRNRDGGMPTFCRGWGRLPFDRSACDISAHAAAACAAWAAWPQAGGLIDHLGRRREAAGSWPPLWFGCQHAGDEVNRTYGTARVVDALCAWARACDVRDHHGAGEELVEVAVHGARWLGRARNADGGWGGDSGCPSTIEETALAVGALAHVSTALAEVRDLSRHLRAHDPTYPIASWRVPDLAAWIAAGLAWLARATADGTRFDPAPIGFYFAKLWYFERLYPLVFTVAAVGRARRARAVATS